MIMKVPKKRVVIGIDPGKKGAAVILSSTRNILDVYDYIDPLETSNVMARWKKNFDIGLAVLEQVHSFPGQGVVSSFSFGMNYGVWQGVLSAVKIPWQLVTPRTWQKGLVTPSDGSNAKERSLAVARRLFPTEGYFKRKKDADRADAVLMAVHALGKLLPIKAIEVVQVSSGEILDI